MLALESATSPLLSAMVRVEQTRALTRSDVLNGSAIAQLLGCGVGKRFGPSSGMSLRSEITYLNAECGLTASGPKPPAVTITRIVRHGSVYVTLRYDYGYLAEGASIYAVASAFKASWEYLPPQLLTDGAGLSTSVQYFLRDKHEQLRGDVDPRTKRVVVLQLVQIGPAL